MNKLELELDEKKVLAMVSITLMNFTDISTTSP